MYFACCSHQRLLLHVMDIQPHKNAEETCRQFSQESCSQLIFFRKSNKAHLEFLLVSRTPNQKVQVMLLCLQPHYHIRARFSPFVSIARQSSKKTRCEAQEKPLQLHFPFRSRSRSVQVRWRARVSISAAEQIEPLAFYK